MSTIVTRAGKGSPLTNTEVDSNFTNLNTDKVESITSADGSVVVSSSGTTRDLSVGTAANTGTLISQVRNETGATLTKGTVVYISGAAGNKALVSKALATGDSTSAQTYGMVQADIPHNQNGYVVVVGAVSGLNTSAFADGTQLYLSGVSAGGYTNTKPYAPTHLVYVGIVTYSHNTQGTIQVKIQNGYELDEIHDVSARSPVDGQTLVYVSSTGLWTKTDQASMSVGSAATLATARNINGVSFNGSADITVADATKLPLAGGTLTGKLTLDGRNEVYGVPTNAGTIAGFMGGTSGGTTAARTQSLNTQTLLNVAAIGYTGSAWVGGAGLSFVATENITASNRGTKAVLTAIAAGDSVATTMEFNGSALTINGSTAVTSSNYNTYAPTKTGTGASGTWAINITGNAATATSATDSTKLPLAGGTLTGRLITTASANSDAYAGAIRVSPSSSEQWGGISFPDTNAGTSSANNYWFYGRGNTIADRTLTVHIPDYSDYSSTGAIPSWGVYKTGANNLFRVFANGLVTVGGNTVLHAGNYNSYSPTLTGTGASGTWGISITGNAATASNSSAVNGLSKIQMWNNSGQNHTTYQAFSSIPNFGNWFMQNSSAADAPQGGTQWYVSTVGLGNDYAYGDYAMMTAVGRDIATRYMWLRFREGSTWSSWTKAAAGYADTAGSAGSVDYNALTNKSGGTGSYVTSGDYRAPVFYDSNDTTYYLDPNSSTAAILAGSVGVGTTSPVNSAWGNASDTKQVTIYGSNYGVLNLRGDYLTDAHYSMGAGDSRFYAAYDNIAGIHRLVFNGNNTGFNNVVTPSYNIHLSGTGYATSDWRAPIFYDSQDTSFAVDPNATSAIRSMTVGYNGSSLAYDTATSGKLYFGSSGSDATDYYHIATTMQNYGGNYSKLDFKWYTGQRFYAHSAYGGFRFHEITNNTQIFSINEGGAFALANQSMRAPIFYDSNDTGYYLDPTSGTTSLKVGGALVQGSTLARPLVSWGEGGTVTGAIVIKLPGTSPGNYGMIHAVIDIYEYNGNNVSTVTIGGHNWSTGWYNYGTNVTGYTNKPIRLCVVGGQYAIVIGNDSSTWEYGQVVLRKIHNGAYYSGIMDMGGTYSIYRTTSVGASWDSGDTNNFRSTTITGLGSVRAPIFYDSDDTNYYVDPTGTSNTNTVKAVNFRMGNALYLGDNNYYINNNSTWFGTNSSFRSDTDVRATIFYDNNDTTYYLNPAEGSNIFGLDLTGASNKYLYINPGNGWEAMVRYNGGSGNTWYVGKRISTDLVGTESFHFYSQAAGQTVGGIDTSGNMFARGSSRAPIFYDSQDTAFYCDPNGTTRLAALTVGYAQNYSTIDMYDGDEGTRYIHNNSGTIGFLNNGGSWRFRVADDGNVIMGTYQDWMSNQLRSAIFYDHNDTNYYVDPNSGSRLAHIFAGDVASSNDGGWNARIKLVGSSHARLDVVSNSDGIVTTMYSHTGQGVGKVGTYSNHPLILMAQGGNDGGSVYNGSLRSPIFYDSDNTGYYVDPASTSNLNRLLIQPRIDNYYVGSVTPINPVSDWQSLTNVEGQFSVAQFNYIPSYTNSPASVYTYGAVISTRTQNHSFQLYAAHTGDLAYKTQWNNDNYTGWLYPMVYGRNNGTGGSVYGTVFYDGNDSAYYVDPNSNSKLVNLGLGGAAPDVRLSVSGDAHISNVLHMGGTAGSYNSWGSRDYTTSGNRYFNANSFEFNNYGYGSTWTFTVGGGIAQSSGSLRAPIFYDSGNTAYYTDPASTSVLNGVTANTLTGNINGMPNDGNAISGMGPITTWDSRPTVGSAGFGINWHTGVTLSGYPGYGGVRLYASSYPTQASSVLRLEASSGVYTYGQFTNDSRVDAPIFYDSNNTGYYLDPTSTTAIRTVGSWRADSAAWDGEFSGKMQYHSSNWYLQYAGSMLFRNSGGSNVFTVDQSGNAVASGNVTAYSDARLKENVVTIDSALDKTLRLRGVYYNKIGNPERRVGVIAQETETVLPEVVRSVSDTNPTTGETTELLAVDYGNISGLLIEAMKEQNQEVVDLRNRVAQLESLINKLIGD
jgi:hypothetical protein